MLPRAPWELNAFWLKPFYSHEGIAGSMRKFFTFQDPNNSNLQHWDAFKAYLRDLLVTEMNRVKHASSALKTEVESQVQAMEQLCITNPFDSAREAWQAAQSAFALLLSRKEIIFQAGIL